MEEQKRIAQEIWTELEGLPVADCWAVPTLGGMSPTNPWECVRSAEKKRVARWLSHENSRNPEEYSDFEALSAWEKLRLLCPGMGADQWSREEWKWMQVEEENIQDRWCFGTEFLSGLPEAWEPWFAAQRVTALYLPMPPESKLFRRRFDIEALLENADGSRPLADWIRELGEQMVEDGEPPHVYLRLPSRYQRPDPYHAGEAFRKMTEGKPLSEETITALRLQVLIDLLIRLPKELTPVIHWEGDLNSEGSRQSFAYLTERKLLRGEIRLKTKLGGHPREWMEAYETEDPRIQTFPELVLSVSDFTERMADELTCLAREYPLGGIRLGGIETDGVTFFIGHRLFRKCLSEVLTNLGCTKEQACLLARKMLAV
ncbi:MAG: hypothetical protein IJY47_07030 [Clostridia bacterium]|nr:hypothetical protein [Clostridia bacterium]